MSFSRTDYPALILPPAGHGHPRGARLVFHYPARAVSLHRTDPPGGRTPRARLGLAWGRLMPTLPRCAHAQGVGMFTPPPDFGDSIAHRNFVVVKMFFI